MAITPSTAVQRAFALGALCAALACSDGNVTGTDDPDGDTDLSSIQIQTLACQESGVNSNPFTVANALAANATDHEVASDYVWNTAEAIPITLSGASITVGGDGASVNGSKVTISAAGTYRLTGTLDDGQVVVNAAGALVRLVLDGVTLNNSADAPLIVTKAAKTVLILADNSVNRVTDGATYPSGVDQNAAIYSEDNLSIGGAGSLIVTARYNDGITSKDGLVIAGGTISVTAADDGIRGKDYLVVRNGTLDITSGGDGLKSDEDGDATQGYVLVAGGTTTIRASGDGVQAETDALVTDGTLTITAGGGSNVVLSDDLSAKGIKGLLVVVDGGTIKLDTADDGLHSDGELVINGGQIEIASGDDAVHADAELVINGGDIDVTKSYEGIENAGADMTINGGRIRVVSSDDGINMSGAGDMVQSPTTYYLYINGGYIVSNATGDGVDANGSIVMTGGCLIVHGPSANNNAAVDYDGTFRMTGGFLVAAGSSGMAQATSAASSQPSALLSFSSRAAGTLVHISSADGKDVIDFVPARAYQSIAVSSPVFATGSSYRVYFGGSATGTLADGLYQGGIYTPGTLATTFTLSSTATRVSF